MVTCHIVFSWDVEWTTFLIILNYLDSFTAHDCINGTLMPDTVYGDFTNLTTLRNIQKVRIINLFLALEKKRRKK